MSTKARLEWSDFWAMFNTQNEEIKTALAVCLNAGDSSFNDFMSTRSRDVLLEILRDAPLEVLHMYLYLLPSNDARKVALRQPPSEYERLAESYVNKNRKMIEAPR